MAKVAFIGLGQMGAPMARNLLRHGHGLQVYDLNPQAVASLAADGAQAAASPADAARGMEVVITMLPDGQRVREVLLGAQGVAGTLAPGALVVEMSTIHPLESDALAQAMAERGFSFMDAPVGRTSEHAVAGTLLILAGGTPEQVSRAAPLLRCMGDTLVEAGGPGRGIRIKIVNNYMSIALNALSAEAAVLCEALGLPLATALEVMGKTSAGRGHFTTSWPEKVLKGDLSPAFMIDLAHKDLGLALDIGGQLRVPLPLGAAARELYSQARAQGRGRQDWSALLEQVRAAAGRDHHGV
ncbi:MULTISPECIES: sulfolactaldehyde 3-reductase [Yersiniaceae]|uniref:Sulfolactaldehyde 3-reductase n=2 Tax=Yersiniaceae TaxID=1903411 RepID=A0A2N5ESL9_9GAMM|nr:MULTISPECIES: sulfolactaldehyde 3-reductase [Yersiniaceae]MBS0970175.1 sulfolactaldehyde 3-reductase [Nissabacter archeti]PLR32974.1 sulfolactaldehyde 3-reductase [Chimaeribacter arupi]PLR49437.1 sulfolactaldehyde 3-reductase [Chimaeribacter arupi]PLR53099.1 sulfolactaldehyde 3-reductase [Chimaeribacter arupi]